jgi:predicted MFS family arabinose efflux permease
MASNQINRDFGILFFVMLINGAGNTALQSILPALGRTLHVPDSLIAGIFSISAALWVISAPFWAARSDRQGRKQMVLLGISGFFVSMLLVAFILTAGMTGLIGPLTTVTAVIAARMIYGMFGSASPPAAQAIIALRTSRAERLKALTLLGSAFGLGTILGPALAPYLVLPVVGLAGPAYAFAIIGGAAFFCVYAYLPEDEKGGTAHGASFTYPSIGGAPAGASISAANEDLPKQTLRFSDERIKSWMLTCLFAGHAQAMTGAVMGFLVIDRLSLSPTELATQQSIGLVLMTGAGASLLVQWGIIPVLGLAPRMMVIVGLAIASLGVAFTAAADTLYGIATAYALACIGFGFSRPGLTAGSSLAVGRNLQGAVAGRVTAVNGAAFVFAPSIGVGLYQFWGPLPFVTASVMLALTIFYASAKLTLSGREEPPSRA